MASFPVFTPPEDLAVKTIILEEPGTFRLRDTERPAAPGPGEARVRVRAVGICGTDLHAYRGRQPFFSYPRILGHELGVEVLEVGDGVEGLEPGATCAVEPYLYCGQCLPCRRGRTNCCTQLRVLGVHLDGGMREEIIVPASHLHRSGKLGLETLALVETLGIGAHAVDRARLERDEPSLVIGAGPIGLSVIQFAVLAGARVHVLELDARRREFCSSLPGVEAVLEPGESTREELRELTGGELPTAVFDATGNPRSMQAAFDLVESTGRLVLVGLFQGELSFDDPEFHRRELTVMASRNSTSADFRRILGHLEAGEIDVRPWITHKTGPDRLPDEFPGWLDPGNGTIKAVLEFPG